MEKTILTRDQACFLEWFKKSALRTEFYLSGGTALAEFYLHHRYSEDLDFFIEKEFPQIEIERLIQEAKKILGAEEIVYQRRYDRRIFYFHFPKKENLKIEFTQYPFKQIEKPTQIDGLLIDSFRDIAVNKLITMFDRTEAKDFFDLYWIAKKRFSFNELRQGVQKKFDLKFDDLSLGSEFAKVKDISFQRIRSIKKATDEEIKHFFEKQSRALMPKIFY